MGMRATALGRAATGLALAAAAAGCGGFQGRTDPNARAVTVVSVDAPVITSPTTSTAYTNGSSLTISGTCATGNLVNLGGSATQVASCSAGAFSFTVSASSDATYDYTVTQTSQGVTSSSASQRWIRDTAAPTAPTVTAPAANPTSTSGSSLTISGACEAGATVSLSGASSSTTTCSSGGSYSFSVSKSSDGSYAFNLTQTDLAGNTSTTTAQTWVRDTSAPAAPTITTPAASPSYSNGSALTISGGCETGATVTLAGASTATTTCASSAYSFNVSKSSDSNYDFTVTQTDAAGNTSSAASHTWVRDTVAPSAPTVTTPATSPYRSNGGSITIAGVCETGATVTLGGASSSTTTCAGNAYSFNVSKGSDGTYNFTVAQTDLAGNTSATSTSQQWIRDTAAPSTPTITTPASSPTYTNGSSFTISGACETNATVSLSTNGTATSTTTCASSAYSFNVTKSTDATYAFTVGQTDQAGNSSAGTASTTWVRDTAAPSAPTITNPATSPYTSSDPLTLSGTCEAAATVTLGGDDSQTTTCSSGSFTFTISETGNATYNYTVSQTDRASNTSTTTAQQWVRNNSLPATPTFTGPGASPYYSNGSSITLTGTCVNGNTVTLAGDASASMTCAPSGFSFLINKAADATYNFTVTQTDAVDNTLISAAASYQWIRDTAAPSTPTITTPASSPTTTNGGSITISGACENNATVTLGGASSATTTCTSSAYSFTVTKGSDSTYAFTVGQTDRAGNSSASTASTSWVRDTAAPSAPTVTTPSSDPSYSNSSSFTISGGCETGATVTLAGSGSGTTTCASSAYSFTVNKSSDNTYSFTLSQTDTAGNTSTSTSQSWIRDTVAPSAPTITTPASSPHYSNGSSLTISGACENAATVTLSGSDSATTTCSSNSYSFTVNHASDNTYSYTVTQTDRAGNGSSGSASLSWVRDAAAPSAPTITTPASNPAYTNGSSLTISGACENGATVALSGDSTGTTTCSSSSYSFTVNKSSDNTYSFTVAQTDRAGNASSGSASQTWVRDTSAPSAPTITIPSTNPNYTNGSSITLSGACEANATVYLSGASTSSTTCSGGGTYSFNISKSSDSSYSFSVSQTDRAGNSSTSTAQTWVRDTSSPSAPTITTPASSPYYSNGSTLTISGACETGDTVSLSGAGSGTTTCSAGAYSFSGLSQTVDGTYAYTVTQTDPAGNAATGSASVTWVRDATAPAAPVITNPNTTPFVSGDTALTISGTCETGATVALAGSSTGSTTCASGAFSFSVSKSTDATYNFTVTQTDLASNASASAALQWIRDTSVPPTPTLTAPTSNPNYTNSTPITISGTCVTGNTVVIDDGSATPPSTTCASSAFSFSTLPASGATEGTYTYSITQESASGVASSAISLSVTKDTTAPSAPTILNPSSSSSGSPYTAGGNLYVSGTCELNSTVSLSVVSGGGSGSSTSCSSSGTFTFTVVGPTDLTNYQYSVTQTDRAGNVSSGSSIYWRKDNSVLPAPIVTSPTVNPYYSSGNSVDITGSCTTGYTVYLNKGLGDQQSTTCAAQTFSFTVTASSDATRSYSLLQSNGSTDSPAYNQQWIRDTSAPTVTLTVEPTAPNYSADAYYAWTVSDSTATVSCRIDSAAFAPCTSPKIYSNLSTGSHTFEVKAVDSAGNTSTVATDTFTQMDIYNTIALYHLDASGYTTDSSLFTAGVNNPLSTVSGTPSSSLGASGFGECRSMTGTSGLSATDSASLGAIAGKLTAETRVYLNSTPNNNDYYVLMGQHNASPNMGWELRLLNKGGKSKFIFVVSTNGTSTGQIQSSNTSSSLVTTSAWHHVAVTFNYGAARVYFDGKQVASGTIGTSGQARIYNNSAPFRLGYAATPNSALSQLDGYLDEARVSQSVRYLAPFTSSVPSSPFTAD